MRLLLFLSALLSALSGVTGSRSALAQPVAASASASSEAASDRAAQVVASHSFAQPSATRPAAQRLAQAPIPALLPARPLYADRRRE